MLGHVDRELKRLQGGEQRYSASPPVEVGKGAVMTGSWAAGGSAAVVAMAAMKEHDLPHAKVNIHGGACALGHPIGASGARLIVTLIGALKKTGGKRGIASLCIGGGEATAVGIELV